MLFIEGVIMRRLTLIVVTCLALCLLGTGAFAASAQKPPVSIPGIDAAALFTYIESHKGKVVVLNMFASWCPPCRKEVPRLVNIRKNLKEDEVHIFGVAVHDQPRALANYMSEMHINYPVFLGERYITQEFSLVNKKTRDKVEVSAVPMLLIFNKKGELVSSDVGLLDEESMQRSIRAIGTE